MEPELDAYLSWLRGSGASFSVADDLARDPDFDGPLVLGEETVRRLILEQGEEEMPSIIEHRDPERGLTADHATQAVAREMLRRPHVRPMEPLWEVGSGTGVLATLGVLLGALPAYGVDLDPRAVALARRTANDTGVEVEWLVGSLLEPIPDPPDGGDGEEEEDGGEGGDAPPLVIANLPHKPCPDRLSLPVSQDGGPEGDEVFAAFRRQAEERLPGGSRLLFFLHSLPHPRLLADLSGPFDLRLLSWKRRWIGGGEFGPLLDWFRGRAADGTAWMGEEGGRSFLVSGVWEGTRRPR